MTRSNPAEEAGLEGVGTPFDHTRTHRRNVRLRVEAASLEELAGWLDLPVEVEYGRLAIGCPRCQRRTLRGPAASSPDGTAWSCSLCRSTGTVFGLAYMVLRDPVALARVADDEGGEQ